MRTLTVLIVAVLAGCSGKTAPAPETSAHGTLALSTFPSSPAAVVATDGAGKTVRSAPDAAGAFVLSLPKGQSYALTVEASDRTIPIAMPRSSGKIERTFRVSSDGAVIDLGSIRYRAPGSDGTPTASDPTDTNCENGSKGDTQSDGECVNGVDTMTKAACTDPADPSDSVASSDEMAVPENDPPRDASGCGGADGETAD